MVDVTGCGSSCDIVVTTGSSLAQGGGKCGGAKCRLGGAGGSDQCWSADLQRSYEVSRASGLHDRIKRARCSCLER